MAASLKMLGQHVRRAREKRALSRSDIAQAVTAVDAEELERLEAGERLLRRDQLDLLCGFLSVPEKHWKPLFSTESTKRKRFEEFLEELLGTPQTIDHLDQAAAAAADAVLEQLIGTATTGEQARMLLNRLLTFYGVRHVSTEFFDHYFTARAFASDARLREAVERYQIDAIRLFSSFEEAFVTLNSVTAVAELLQTLAPLPDEQFRSRRAWTSITQIQEDRLADLGYISAAEVRRERDERTAISDFLRDLATRHEDAGRANALVGYSQAKLRRMDSLLRKFSSTIPHGFLSPLFSPDADALRREAERLGPKEEHDLSRMERTQSEALQNLSNYLTADYMDVYVATSMRTQADFVSVNRFVTRLFSHSDVAPLNLRFFNPTQSWIEDRVAKGLVEALMLRRSSITIYMAQKDDTFGKDSEASVALGQGKPVIVYVPRLFVPELDIDSASLSLMSRNDLAALVAKEGSEDDRDLDATFDREALHARLLGIRLEKAQTVHFAEIARQLWADFDLYGEADRVTDEAQRRMFREWLDAVVKRETQPNLPVSLFDPIKKMLVAITMRFERRAEIFREIHPLALQVILSTGVLNGILVVRSVESCAELLSALLRNELELQLRRDENNYRVVEAKTQSTVRVISRHRLLSNAFKAFYSR
jgi:transcriptional regulator with XRE-family HTH domain